MENFAEFVHSLAPGVTNISDSLGMRTSTSFKIQTLDKKNNRFRTWVGEMEHDFMLADSSEDQKLRKDVQKTGGAIARYT